MQTAFHLLQELIGTTAQNECARLRLWAILEDIESLPTYLLLFKSSTCTHVFALDIEADALYLTSNGLRYTTQVRSRHASSTKDVSISKPLCCDVTNRSTLR